MHINIEPSNKLSQMPLVIRPITAALKNSENKHKPFFFRLNSQFKKS